jgi:hypothetical protein
MEDPGKVCANERPEELKLPVRQRIENHMAGLYGIAYAVLPYIIYGY